MDHVYSIIQRVSLQPRPRRWSFSHQPTSTSPMSLFKQHRPAFGHAASSYAGSTSPSPPAAEGSTHGPYSATGRDASEKTESAPQTDSANLHHIPCRPTHADIPGPHRGLYDQRRVPSALAEIMSHARSRSSGLRSRLGGGEGGLGRALILGWIVTTAMFLLATAFWRGQLFSGRSQSLCNFGSAMVDRWAKLWTNCRKIFSLWD